MSVVKLLNRLELNRETVLVISQGTLVPGDAMLDDDAEIEIRPVIRWRPDRRGRTAVKCRVCREPAVIDLRRHNANFCVDHFLRYCDQQLAKAIDEFEMFRPGERLLVAVSGGKDSLAVWDLLVRAGWEADGLYVGLGIGDYSETSAHHARALPTTTTSGSSSSTSGPTTATTSRRRLRSPAGSRARPAACPRRHLFDRAAIEGGYDALVTGHNLDDEAAVLYGNTLRWQVDYLGRQRPVLPARPGSPARSNRWSASPSGRRRLLRAAGHRLPGGGVPHGRRQQASDLQGRPERDGTAIAWLQVGVLLRLPGRAAERFEAPEGPSELGRCQHCDGPAEGELCALLPAGRTDRRGRSGPGRAPPDPLRPKGDPAVGVAS